MSDVTCPSDYPDGYEYGILYPLAGDEPHRANMTEDEAREWIREAQEEGFRPGAFVLIRRPVGSWERA